MIAESRSAEALQVKPGGAGLRRHAIALFVVFGLAILIYIPALRSYYCGYDDFNEALRAREDLSSPAQMFTTSHFHTSKYRPLNRAFTALAYSLGKGAPVAFRIRNLGFHLAGAAAVYGIAFLILESAPAAFAASLLFALHPLANQSVVGATWTNTTAYALMFASFLLFVSSVNGSKAKPGRLAASLLLSGLALFTYEATLVVFALMAVYVTARAFWSDKPRPPMSFLGGGAVGTVAICGAFFLARSHFAEGQTGVSSLNFIVGNLVIYAGALALPVDPLLANSLFGFPLPSELLADPSLVWLAAVVGFLGIGSVLLFAVVNLIVSARSRGRRIHFDWRIVFCLGAIAATLLPFLVFTEHASETYLYPGAAFVCVLITLLGRKFVPRKWQPAAVIIAAVMFGSATLARNERVLACGTTAARVLAGLPVNQLREGSQSVALSYYPDDYIPPHYGIYSYTGIGTIDPGGAGAATSALRLITRNPLITGEVVAAELMPRYCTGSRLCFWVHSDGAVEAYHKPAEMTR